MLKREFTPSFRVALAAKDAGLAVEGAQEAGLDLPMIEAIAARMRDVAERYGDEDLAATYLASAPTAGCASGGRPKPAGRSPASVRAVMIVFHLLPSLRWISTFTCATHLPKSSFM